MNTIPAASHRLAAVALFVGAAGAIAQTPAARLLPAQPVESSVGRGASPEYKLFDPSNPRDVAKWADPNDKPGVVSSPKPESKSLFDNPFGGVRDKVFGKPSAPAAKPPVPLTKPIQTAAFIPPAIPAGQAGVYAGPPAYRWYGWGTTTPGANPFAPSGQYPRGSANWYAQTGATPGAFPVPVSVGGTQVIGYEPPSYVGSPPPYTVASAGINPTGPFFGPVENPPAAPPTRQLPVVTVPNKPRPQPATVPAPVVTPLPAAELPVPMTPLTLAPPTDQPLPFVSMSGQLNGPATAQPQPLTEAPATGKLTWQAAPESRSDKARFTAVRGSDAPPPTQAVPTTPPPTEPTFGPLTPLPSPPAFAPPTGPTLPTTPPETPWAPAKPTARGQATEPPAVTLDGLVRNACYGLATVNAVRQTGPGTLVIQFTADTEANARTAAEAVSKLPQLKAFEVRFVATVHDRK